MPRRPRRARARPPTRSARTPARRTRSGRWAACSSSARARRSPEIDALAAWKPGPLPASRPIEVGAIVGIEDPETGQGRTFFLAPVGAGAMLTGPGGDGVLSVVTPASPIGRAVLGHKVGDVVAISAAGELREWEISYVG